jgi:hypothetical protein
VPFVQNKISAGYLYKKNQYRFMDRVGTLLQKLQEQFDSGAAASQLMLTVQMLQHELAHLQAGAPTPAKSAVSIAMPVNTMPAAAAATESPVQSATEERTVEVLQVDEAAVEAELEEIKRNAAAIQHISTKSKPQLLFDMGDDEIPTLPKKQTPAASREINDSVAQQSTSVNEILKEEKTELSEKLTTDTPVKDLKKAIGVNDRFLYINELFRGDEAMYERSIKTINSFSIWPEAEYWIRRELKTKLGWVDSDAAVMQFDQLVKRRFA